MVNSKPGPQRELKRGWTTGACATAATKAAFTALLTGKFPDPVEIILPKGDRASFPLAVSELGRDFARAGIVKDAGDDPDVTHGATVIAAVRLKGNGVTFRAGKGVGTVTKPGLPLAPGEPAINPVPRQMMRSVIEDVAREFGAGTDVEIEISIPGGEDLAAKTWNGRLGIIGGLSILGTTGIVHPFSCSAWIHSIYRGIDVARASGIGHVAGATGSTSEEAVRKLYGLSLSALIDMGDFVGAMLKYLRHHPIARVTIAGGFGKMTKLAQGALDLHSERSRIDFDWLARFMPDHARAHTRMANSALEVEQLAASLGVDVAGPVARAALDTVRDALKGAPIEADVVIVSRSGEIMGRA